MAGELDIKLEVLGDVILARRLSRMAEGVQDMRPAFAEIVNILEEATKTHFDQRGRGEWPPLSPAYAEWKRAHYPGKPIMRRTDALYNSLTKGGRGNIKEIEPLTLRWGTRIPYAGMHQKGGGTLPRRRVVHLIESEKKAITKAIQRYLVSLRDQS